METTDVSKLFLAIFERTFYGLYMCHFLWLQHVSIKSNDTGFSKFALPNLKNSPKKPNQKWFKCCMKAPIRQVLLQTSLFIVLQFSTRYLKSPAWTFLWKISSKRTRLWLLWNLFQVFHKLAFWVEQTLKRSLELDFWLTLLLCFRGSQSGKF